MIEFSSYLEQQNEKGDDSLCVVEAAYSIWFCISDGAGGTGAGEWASGRIVEEFKKLVLCKDFESPDDFEAFLRNVDDLVARESQGAEATAIIGRVVNCLVVGASVGDSEAWLFNSGYDYELTSMQNMKPLIGSGISVPIGFGPIELDKALLIGSDGLFKYVNHNEIKRVLSSKGKAVDVAELAKNETGRLQDDISAICIRKMS